MKLSIIIINYNTFNLTCQCIKSIEEKCIEIRKEIKRYKEILKQIEQKLNE